MTQCNIILLEDVKKHRESLERKLKQEYEHIVVSFRDRKTFYDACQNETITYGFNEKLSTIVILDIMMAEELDEKADFAPRRNENTDPALSDSIFTDDELGLEIAREIRNGKTFKNIDPQVPLLFFTGRQHSDVLNEIHSDTLQPASYIAKPAWITEVQEAIEQLLKKVA